MKTAALFLLMMTPETDMANAKMVFEVVEARPSLGLRECLRYAYEFNTLLGNEDKPWAVCAPEIPR